MSESGGVIRNSKGEWVMGYSRNLGIADYLQGLLDGLLQAHLLAIQFLEVEIDSHIVVDLIHSHDTDSYPLLPLFLIASGY